ncbi:MAG: DUF2199 domain-containing protein [Pseudomonadota bacterium]
MIDLEGFEWTCASIGVRRRSIPDLVFEGPLCFEAADDNPNVKVLEKTDDVCVAEIHGRHFSYIRCVLPMPIQGAHDHQLNFGVWASLSEVNFGRYVDAFFDLDQSKLGLMFDYLGNALPGYPNTENLQLTVAPRDNRLRPQVYVQDDHACHPLFIDQQRGISQDKLAEFLASMDKG